MASKSPKKPIAALAVLALVSALLASLTITAGAQTPAPISADTFTLTILHNNDGESKLLPDEDCRVSWSGPLCRSDEVDADCRRIH